MSDGGANEVESNSQRHPHDLPSWHYNGIEPEKHQQLPGEDVLSYPALDGPNAFNLGDYSRLAVSNVDLNPTGRAYFDVGLRLMLSFQHELAAKCFLACLEYCPYAVLAHGLVALCHSPNYNFKGEAYYLSADHPEDMNKPDLLCVFPSQQVADRHSKMALETVEYIRKVNRVPRRKKGRTKATVVKRSESCNSTGSASSGSNSELPPSMVSELEVQWLMAIRVLTQCPGVDPDLSEETVGNPYASAMRKVYQKFPRDPEIAYCYAESMMVLHAWKLYEYPSGKPVTQNVHEIRKVLEDSLKLHPKHAGLCHLYVHLSEMSAEPELALAYCEPLRNAFPHAGHLIHMPTHIDVLVGDYEACVRYNKKAIVADLHASKASPATAGKESFYFGYIVHDYHMAVYGAILGGMEGQAMELSAELNQLVNEDVFTEFPDLVAYLESYAALDIHCMIRFGCWKELLELEPPKDSVLMLYRASSLHYARGLAYAALGDPTSAKKEAEKFDRLRNNPDSKNRILHNNTVADLLALDAVMLRGEIAYHDGKYEMAFALLRRAVEMQDNLNYDEPWGKMQPIRHALGGLLLEQGQIEEAEDVFRKDLMYHPRNPWALVGLIGCLREKGECCSGEIKTLEADLQNQRSQPWSDYSVLVACECCKHPPE